MRRKQNHYTLLWKYYKKLSHQFPIYLGIDINKKIVSYIMDLVYNGHQARIKCELLIHFDNHLVVYEQRFKPWSNDSVYTAKFIPRNWFSNIILLKIYARDIHEIIHNYHLEENLNHICLTFRLFEPNIVIIKRTEIIFDNIELDVFY